MSKELRAMLEGINNMKDEVKSLYAEGKDAEAQAKMDELEAAQAKFENLKKLEDVQAVPAEPKAAPARDPVHDFAEAARRRFQNVASEGTSADGGYTVPEDIKTQVEKLRDATFSLRQLVRVESVRTMSGARTFQVKGHQAAWAAVTEMGAIGAALRAKRRGDLFFAGRIETFADNCGLIVIVDELACRADDRV